MKFGFYVKMILKTFEGQLLDVLRTLAFLRISANYCARFCGGEIIVVFEMT